jgi:hypothetical protein
VAVAVADATSSNAESSKNVVLVVDEATNTTFFMHDNENVVLTAAEAPNTTF